MKQTVTVTERLIVSRYLCSPILWSVFIISGQYHVTTGYFQRHQCYTTQLALFRATNIWRKTV